MLARWMYGDPLAYFSMPCRFDALLYGSLLAMLLERWRRTGMPSRAVRFFTAVAISCALLLGAVLYRIRPVVGREIRLSILFMVFGLSLFSICVAAVMGLLLLRSGSNWWLARLLRARSLRFIGTISYTMYLVHLIIGTAVHDLGAVLHLGWPPLPEALVSAALTILVSYLSWHWLEKPLLRWKDRHFPASPHPREPALN